MNYIRIVVVVMLGLTSYPAICKSGTNTIDVQGHHWCSYRSNGNNSGSVDAPGNKGKLIWTADVSDGVPSEVVASKQRIAFLTVRYQTGLTKLYAIDCRTGFLKWIKEISTTQNYHGSPVPAVDESGNVYVSTVEGRVLAFRISDGKQLWAFTAPQESVSPQDRSASSIKTDASHVYCVANGMLYSLDKSTGTQQWQVRVGRLDPTDAPAVDSQGNIYVLSEMGLIAVNRDSGNLLWQTRDYGPCSSWGLPVIAGEKHIYEPGGDKIACLDRFSGELLWLASFSGAELMHPAVYKEQTLLVIKRAGYEGKLLAIDGNTGQVKWTYSPVTNGDRVSSCGVKMAEVK